MEPIWAATVYFQLSFQCDKFAEALLKPWGSQIMGNQSNLEQLLLVSSPFIGPGVVDREVLNCSNPPASASRPGITDMYHHSWVFLSSLTHSITILSMLAPNYWTLMILLSQLPW